MNRYANPHAGYTGYQTPVDPRYHNPQMPQGHPYGPMTPVSMQPPPPDPRLYQEQRRGPVVNMQAPQGYDPRYAPPPPPQYDPRYPPPPPQYDPRYVPPQGYDPRYPPPPPQYGPDPRYQQPIHQYHDARYGGGSGNVSDYCITVDAANVREAPNVAQREQAPTGGGRFGEQVAQRPQEAPQQYPVPSTQRKKEFMLYNPKPNESLVNEKGMMLKIPVKRAAVQPSDYLICDDLVASETLEGVLETALESLNVCDNQACGQLCRIDDPYYKTNLNQEVFTIYSAPSIKETISLLNEHFRTVKDKYSLVVFKRINAFFTDRINDIILVNSPSSLTIQSFREDYFDLVKLFESRGQQRVIDVFEDFFENIRLSAAQYVLPDEADGVLKTVVPQYVTVTAIDATSYEARIGDLARGVTLLIQDGGETRYIHSLAQVAKEALFATKKTANWDCDCRYIKHYLVTIDKSVYELTYSLTEDNAYITRVS